MTIALSVKIDDGLVLATDSATTVLSQVAPGQLGVVNVYSNANKLFNLCKGLPIGAITWGAGSIGNSSISALMKDIRERFSDKSDPWAIDRDKYTIKEVAAKLKEFIFDDIYTREFKNFPNKPPLGFLVAGYSAKGDAPEEFQIETANGQCREPKKIRDSNDAGITWSGEPEAINRLLVGYTPQIWQVIKNSLSLNDADVLKAKTAVDRQSMTPLVFPAMPLQDAIELAEFLVDLTIKFSRFKPGAPTVGGPIEIAAISKHEGFRWIKRKYYFDRDLNPEGRFTRTYIPTTNEDN